MQALQRKLLRNLWTLKGQGAAIGLVIACGVAMFVMSLTTLDSLRESQRSVYDTQQFADVFASLKRAPEGLAQRLMDIEGVVAVDTRVQAPVTLRMPGQAQPLNGMALSLPEGQQPLLNRLFLRTGYLPQPDQPDGVVLSDAFAEAHELQPGDVLPVVINGRYQRLHVTGIGGSPEFIYQAQPGELVPDAGRYAILWMNRTALAASFNMEGAFNQVSLSLAGGVSVEAVLEAVDSLLSPWGGLGAYGRSDQLSHRYLESEIELIAAMALFLPLIFILVAAFLLNVVTSRLVRIQRDQIAVLKAFGYRGMAIALHFLQLVMVIVLISSLVGILGGAWLARALASLYQEFFRFPWLSFHLRPSVALMAVLITGGAVATGTLSAVLRAWRLPPAEAMRPEPPATYHRTLLERLGVTWLPQSLRIILRNLERQPWKTLFSVLGISLAVAMMMLTTFQRGAIDHMMDVQFRLARNYDVSLQFVEVNDRRALHELQALPQVAHVEGFRSVPARLRFGHREYLGGLQGYPRDMALFRVLSAQLQPLQMPEEGVLLTDHLAERLGIRAGDWLQVEVLEGRRPHLSVPVAGLVSEFLGVGAYMEQSALNRLMGEGDVISGAYLAVLPEEAEALNQALNARAAIAGISWREDILQSFSELMDESILIFTLFSVFLAGSIAFAVVYNNARIAFAERGRELASLRVLGFTRIEVAQILLGELLLLTLLALLPGFVLGAALCWLLSWAMQTDLYRVPLVLGPEVFSRSALVVLLATLLSAMVMLRALWRLDMVAALKQ